MILVLCVLSELGDYPSLVGRFATEEIRGQTDEQVRSPRRCQDELMDKTSTLTGLLRRILGMEVIDLVLGGVIDLGIC